MRRLVYFLIILLTSAIWLSSCRSPQYVPVETKIQLKDSVITRDSVVIKEQTVRKDSVVIKDSTVIVVDESGNVIRTELYRYRDWYKELSRDYSVLQAKYDSLFSEKQKEIQVPYPVERELSWWQSVKLQVGEIAIGIIIHNKKTFGYPGLGKSGCPFASITYLLLKDVDIRSNATLFTPKFSLGKKMTFTSKLGSLSFECSGYIIYICHN